MIRIWPEIVYPLTDCLRRLKSLLLGGRHPLHRAEPIEPVFIVGSGRCGSTLLRRMLVASHQIHIPPETYVLKRVVHLYLRNGGRPWPDLVNLVMAQFEFHPDFDVFGMTLRPLVGRLIELPSPQRSLARMLDAFYRFHGQQAGCDVQRWGDKTPLNVYALDEIQAVFPGAQYVNLVRDGVDVVYSMLCKGGNEDSLEAAASRWTTALAAAGRFRSRHANRMIQMHYERLVTEPAPALSELCSFLGIEFDRSMVEFDRHAQDMPDVSKYKHYRKVAQPIDTSSIGKGRRELTPPQLAELQRLIGHDLKRWGYESAC